MTGRPARILWLIKGLGRSVDKRLLTPSASHPHQHRCNAATHLPPGTTVAGAVRAGGYLTALPVGMMLVARALRDLWPDPLTATSWRLTLGDLEVL